MLLIKKYVAVFAAAAGLILVIGCLKQKDTASCTPVPIANELDTMKAMVRDSAFVMDTTGASDSVFYQIVTAGTGAAPTASSTLTVKYIAYYMNGRPYDSTFVAYPNGVTTPPLNQLIPGWQQGLPKIKEGGQIRLIIPSSLAYGCNPNGGVLANQPLYFNIQLIKVGN
ncbi:MAG: FKBP-type peptidyl-prolyl cis-trans isomerase [Niabella sp.]|nr:FKBP-type peptidyl-prolyl cis-trans isomerase [Niabella sp.]